MFNIQNKNGVIQIKKYTLPIADENWQGKQINCTSIFSNPQNWLIHF